MDNTELIAIEAIEVFEDPADSDDASTLDIEHSSTDNGSAASVSPNNVLPGGTSPPIPPCARLDAVVHQHYPELVPTVHACLAVFATLSLSGRTKPLCLILETPSGYGKSAVLQMFFPKGADIVLDKYVYRSDKFTPKSFVTHAANVKKRT